jgi:hypothetical protein
MEIGCFIECSDDFDADRSFRSVGDIVAAIVGAILADRDRDEDEAVGAASLDEE